MRCSRLRLYSETIIPKSLDKIKFCCIMDNALGVTPLALYTGD